MGKPKLDLKPDKQEFVKILKFVMNIQRAEKIDTAELLRKYPIVFKWGLQFAGLGDIATAVVSFLSIFKTGNKTERKEDQDSNSNSEKKDEYPVDDGIYRIFPMGGMTRDGSILSTDGHELVDIYTHDDASGRQHWIFKKYASYWNIKISGGFYGDKRYLSTDGGKMVCLARDDDGSGRQRWKIKHSKKGGYNVEVCGGMSSKYELHTLLSTDGHQLVDMYTDDVCGRQRWRFERILDKVDESNDNLSKDDWLEQQIVDID